MNATIFDHIMKSGQLALLVGVGTTISGLCLGDPIIQKTGYVTLFGAAYLLIAGHVRSF